METIIMGAKKSGRGSKSRKQLSIPVAIHAALERYGRYLGTRGGTATVQILTAALREKGFLPNPEAN